MFKRTLIETITNIGVENVDRASGPIDFSYSISCARPLGKQFKKVNGYKNIKLITYEHPSILSFNNLKARKA